MKLKKFIGREKEMSLLTKLFEKSSASLVVVKGRRRIGKSRLIHEFGKNTRMISLSGIAPIDGITSAKQRKAFAEQLVQTLHIPEPNSDNWTNLFHQLADKTASGRVVILLDEVSWMAQDDNTFHLKLKNAWDDYLKKNPQLVLILCSSISSWIEENIVNSSAFMGRLSLTLQLQELSLEHCNEFWGTQKNKVSAYEKLKLLSVTGGIPRYLEEIIPTESAESNIRRLCFMKEGILFSEFNHIFHDLFGRRNKIYKQLVEALAKKPRSTLDNIYQYLGIEKQGVISDYLNDLEQAGFIKRRYTWQLETGKESKNSEFSISDNYLRFYLKYIEPNQNRIIKGDFDEIHIDSLPGWHTIMGLQFENLVLNNRKRLLELLNINPANIVYDNPYFQTKTKNSEGCQVDYIIQDSYNTLNIIEIKLSTHKIESTVIQEMQSKIKKLKIPSNFTYRPVLIHVNGISKSVQDSGYFTKIINFSDLI